MTALLPSVNLPRRRLWDGSFLFALSSNAAWTTIRMKRSSSTCRCSNRNTGQTHRRNEGLAIPLVSRRSGRDMWTFVSIERLWQDRAYAQRMPRKNPAITIVAVLSRHRCATEAAWSDVGTSHCGGRTFHAGEVSATTAQRYWPGSIPSENTSEWFGNTISGLPCSRRRSPSTISRTARRTGSVAPPICLIRNPRGSAGNCLSP
jgi:hypothetical protein